MKNTTRLKKPQVPKIGELLYFDDINDRPKYAGQEMTSETSIPSFETIRDDAHSMVVAEAEARTNADADLQEQIDAIVASSDVKDIVGTYAELEDYDTSKLGDKDIIKVLADETHDDAESYYRWSTSAEEFSYIGSVGPYYTQAETDTLIGEKQDILTAGDNVSISAENVISATDTTYSAGDNITISAENVISATNEIKTLTTEDYNYPTTGTKTAVALYLMSPGIYRTSGTVKMNYGGANSVDLLDGTFVIVSTNKQYSAYRTGFIVGGGNTSLSVTVNQSNIPVMNAQSFHDVMVAGQIQNNAATTISGSVLDARMGKTLNDRIGDISTLTTTSKTSTVAAINELVTAIGNVESALHAINNGGNA